MDKDKLIKFAGEQCEIFPEDSYMGKYLRETIKMLQTEPCEDAVSKQDCINAIENTDCELSPQAWKEITNNIMSLPPATPKQGSILDQIRSEIEAQEKWLAEAGYNAYNVSVAFGAIKHSLKK